MLRFKLAETGRSFGLYCKTGDLDHLADIVRILLWSGDGGEEDVSASVHL